MCGRREIVAWIRVFIWSIKAGDNEPGTTWEQESWDWDFWERTINCFVSPGPGLTGESPLVVTPQHQTWPCHVSRSLSSDGYWVWAGVSSVKWVINKELWGGEIDDWPSQITHVEAYCLIKDYHSSRTKPSWYFSMCSSLDCLGFLRFARTPILDFNDTKSDKEEDVELIIIVSVPQILVSRPAFGQEPNLIFYESQVFHCYRFVTNDTDKFNQLWHHIIYRLGGIFNS